MIYASMFLASVLLVVCWLAWRKRLRLSKPQPINHRLYQQLMADPFDLSVSDPPPFQADNQSTFDRRMGHRPSER